MLLSTTKFLFLDRGSVYRITNEEPLTGKESRAGDGEYFAKVPNLGFNSLNPTGRGLRQAVLTENRETSRGGTGGSKSNLMSSFNFECQIASVLINETYNGRIVWLHRSFGHGASGNEAL
jgi:hypothetical protein